ncbi:AAA family ATPase [Pseudoalteromonas byunsanensis]|uniref:Endonuclease GajA/Old nuclease/RecF-like AAA domain-containing protein n=1 Tax=Pseudoalteromonas byunsanensis TaxID=327939 RepID=A0A1S1N5M9_9GAMM|nr:AAA family ATPase [Pseudoalteromonas byunsanensis]OHU93563.1 hypothetical protein BIW53_19675 [Pseudoalteromonas byunsanensis]
MQLEYLYVEDYGPLKNRGIKVGGCYEITQSINCFEVTKSNMPADFYSQKELKLTAFFGRNGSGKTKATELLKLVYQADSTELPEGITALFTIAGKLCYSTTSTQNIAFNYHSVPVEKVEWSTISQQMRGLIYYSPLTEPLSLGLEINSTSEFSYLDISNSSLNHRLYHTVGKRQDIKAIFELITKFKLAQPNECTVPIQLKQSSAPMQVTLDVYRKRLKLKRLLKEGIKVNLASCIKFINKNGLPDTNSELEYLLSDYLNEESELFSNMKEFKEVVGACLREGRHPVDKYFYLSFKSNYVDAILQILERKKDKYHCLYAEHFCHTLFERQKQLARDEVFNSITWIHDRLLFLLKENVKYASDSNIFVCTQHKKNGVEVRLAVSDLLSNFEEGELKDGVITLDIKSFESFKLLNEFQSDAKSLFPPIHFSWKSISSGEYSLLTMLSRLHEAACNTPIKDNITVIIDEGEICLHPELQRSYVANLIKYMDALFCEFSHVNVVITSHSPLILSDIPSHSLNMMDSDEQRGYFGANLYDLFADGFAVDNILSEFAYRRITDLCESMNEGRLKHVSRQDSYIVNEINNPMLEKVISDMMNKRDAS